MSSNAEQALLSAVADEMADLRAGIDDLADLMSALTAYCPAKLRANAVMRNQEFDLIIQRLAGLGGLLSALGAGVDGEVALRALNLSGLSDRLSGRLDLFSAADPSGDLMLFD